MSMNDILIDVPQFDNRPSGWKAMKVERENRLNAADNLRPLLLLYLINKD